MIICRTCELPIERMDDGWVEWLMNMKSGKCHGLRLVHHYSVTRGACCYQHPRPDGEMLLDHHLSHFVSGGKSTVRQRMKGYAWENSYEKERVLSVDDMVSEAAKTFKSEE